MELRAWAEDILAPDELVAAALSRVRDDPASADDADWTSLLGASGDLLTDLCALADDARSRATDPASVTFVVNRNLDTAQVYGSPVPSVADLVVEAADLGATEICLQGPLPAEAPADEYLRLIERIHAAAPGLHLHAYRPPEVRDAAGRLGLSIAQFLVRARDAGLGSVTGTAAQILDDDIRARLAPGGAAAPVAHWVESIETAHQVGLTSTATMLYGHVETPAHQLAHLRLLNEIQDRTHGFTELILMPMVATNTPPHLRAVDRPVASARETRALHAVARLLGQGRFDHLQVAWTKLDPPVVDAVLRGGADDIGGLLLDGRLRPEAGAEAGAVLDVERLLGFAARAGRTPRQRTTAYGEPEAHLRLDLRQQVRG